MWNDGPKPLPHSVLAVTVIKQSIGNADVNLNFSEVFGETFGPVIGLTMAIAIIALALWLAWLLLRRFRSGLFVSGAAKGRLPRLAVIDAVPVDSHRRLILVRRDEVEHLIMIGGPTDIVVEAGIAKIPAIAAQPAALPAAPRAPAQNAQQQPSLPNATLQRPANVAARDAMVEAERGRPVRGTEVPSFDRRNEPSLTVTPPVSAPMPPVQP
ncbi:MAG: hypothetical protein ACRCT6_00760, partial [Notoacmeibacter sp.]